MDELEKYIRSINPKKDEQHILVYNRNYHLWRDGKYLGIATWTKDEFTGDSFQKIEMVNGEQCAVVFTADLWELIVDEKLRKK